MIGRALLAGALLACCAAAGAQPATKPRALSTQESAFKGDLDDLIERRTIRVASPFSRTLYYNDKGRERGVTADLVRDFERWINRKYRKQLGNRPITVVIRPMTFERLMPSVTEGLADIGVGNLTITDERLKRVDFVSKEGSQPVHEVVMTGPKSPPIARVEDLAGKVVHVHKTSSYYESLVALNRRLREHGKPQAQLVLVPDALEDEDLMEMLNAGLLEAIVVDDWMARIWAQVLPKVKVNDGAEVRAGGQLGWAIRKDSPKLAALLREYYATYVKKQGVYHWTRREALLVLKRLNDPSQVAERRRFEETIALFRKYGRQYHFDPLMLAALGYQESQLDQNARSPAGAIGIMQLMPATADSLKVGDIRIAEHNVHAGARYMDHLMSAYLAGAEFDETNRGLFAFACYNAGPGNIRRVRAEAARRGLDPNQWFNNVEMVAAEKIGIETPTYVRNVYKYYIAYTLMNEVDEAQRKARAALKGAI